MMEVRAVETVAVRVAAAHRTIMSRRSSGSMSVTSASRKSADPADLLTGVLAATRSRLSAAREKVLTDPGMRVELFVT